MAAALGVVVGMLIAALAFFVVLPLVGQQGVTGEQGAAQSQGNGSVDPDDDEPTQNQDGDEPTSGQDDDGNDVVESSVYGEPGNQDVISTDTANMLVNADADYMDGALYYKLFTATEEPTSIARRDATGSCQTIFNAPDGYQIIRIDATEDRIYLSYGNGISAVDFTTGTIASMNPDGTDVQTLVTTGNDPSGNLRFYIARGRIYYPREGMLYTSLLDGSDEQEVVPLNGITQWFMTRETIYLADATTFYRVEEDGTRTPIYEGEPWSGVTVSDNYLIVMRGGRGKPRYFTWISLDTDKAEYEWCLDDLHPAEMVKGLNTYGDDLIIDTENEGEKVAHIYRASIDEEDESVDFSTLWERAGMEYVARPLSLEDRIYFGVYVTVTSCPAECSVSAAGGDWRVEDNLGSYPGL